MRVTYMYMYMCVTYMYSAKVWSNKGTKGPRERKYVVVAPEQESDADKENEKEDTIYTQSR